MDELRLCWNELGKSGAGGRYFLPNFCGIFVLVIQLDWCTFLFGFTIEVRPSPLLV